MLNVDIHVVDILIHPFYCYHDYLIWAKVLQKAQTDGAHAEMATKCV